MANVFFHSFYRAVVLTPLSLKVVIRNAISTGGLGQRVISHRNSCPWDFFRRPLHRICVWLRLCCAALKREPTHLPGSRLPASPLQAPVSAATKEDYSATRLLLILSASSFSSLRPGFSEYVGGSGKPEAISRVARKNMKMNMEDFLARSLAIRQEKIYPFALNDTNP